MIIRTPRTIFILLAAILLGTAAKAQELNFSIKVVNPQVRLADPKVFKSLEAALNEYVNGTKWTDDVYEQNERITGTIQITIKSENSATSFSGELAISAQRPVYGATYESPIFTYLDKDFSFSYEQYQQIQYAKNSYGDNLTSTIAYYVYCILGMDYDSFSPFGGEVHWQQAQEIFNTVPSEYKGEWKRERDISNLTRYYFTENMLSPRLRPLRQAIYDYHRLGLDFASQDIGKSVSSILQALERIEQAHQAYPNTLALRTWSATKMTEMIEIFKGANAEQKARFLSMMTKIDPTNASRYAAVGL